jgi:uncharacterized protein (TIGR02421 family)
LKVQSPEKAVSLAQDLFGAKAKAKPAESSPDRPVLGLRETITITGSSGMNAEVHSLLSPDLERTIFDASLVKELERAGALEIESEADRTYRVKFTLGGKKIQTVAQEGEVSPHSVRALIGRRDLGGFLIDPAKATIAPSRRSVVKGDIRAIDKLLSAIDEELITLKHVKPTNLHEERERAKDDLRYNPVFIYAEPEADLSDLEDRLMALTIDDLPAGTLFKKKRRELLQRITMVRSRGNARHFTEASSALFGVPSSVLITSAAAVLRARPESDPPLPPSDDISAEETAKIFEEVLERYGLHDWQVVIREHTIARCTVGGRKVTLRKDAVFSRAFLPALIAHEIETHVLTAENGDHQPYELFRRGFAGYLDTQEGLAIYNQNRFLSENHEKRYGPVRNVLGVAYALENSFAQTRRYLQEELGYGPEKSLNKTIELKRGLGDTSEAGGFTKGLAYYRGLRAIEHYVMQGGDLSQLYIGKIALEDLEVIKQIPGVKAPLVIPAFLRPQAEASVGKGKKKTS